MFQSWGFVQNVDVDFEWKSERGVRKSWLSNHLFPPSDNETEKYPDLSHSHIDIDPFERFLIRLLLKLFDKKVNYNTQPTTKVKQMNTKILFTLSIFAYEKKN